MGGPRHLRAQESGDLGELAQLGRWLKGAGGTAGFEAFTQPASELEQMANTGRVDQIDSALAVIERLVESIELTPLPTADDPSFSVLAS